jgi:hypothetical protein
MKGASKQVHAGSGDDEQPGNFENGGSKIHYGIVLNHPESCTFTKIRKYAFGGLAKVIRTKPVQLCLKRWWETHSTSLIPLRSRMILRMRSTLMARRIRLLLFTTATLFPAIHSCNGQAPLKIEQDQKTERLCVIIMIFRTAMTKKRSLCQGKLVL